MRGKAVEMKLAGTVHGITPACAGKRSSGYPHTIAFEDHHCVCGEKVNAFDLVRLHKGSPPRVRGKALKDGLSPLDVWITPACAGKSSRHQKRTAWEEDHPRVCGEKG